VASNLYVNDSGESIAIKLNDSAPISVYSLHLSKNEEQSVEISLASEEKAGIYKGTIMVTSTDTATGNITTTNITVVATIIYVNPWLSIGQWGIVVLIGFLIFLGLIAPEKKEFLYNKHKFIEKDFCDWLRNYRIFYLACVPCLL
jgi:hypothetical protein